MYGQNVKALLQKKDIFLQMENYDPPILISNPVGSISQYEYPILRSIMTFFVMLTLYSWRSEHPRGQLK